MPTNLLYAREHLWVRLYEEIAVVGLTEYGQKLLSEIVFLELPVAGSFIECGQSLCMMETLKTAITIESPCRGEITEVNEDLLSRPDLLNKVLERQVWFVKIKYDGIMENLLSPEEYQLYLQG